MLMALLVNVTCVSLALASGKAEKDFSKSERKIKKHALKIKAGVEKLGEGKDSVVKVKLRDKQEITGYVDEIADWSFTIVDANGTSKVIDYTSVKQIKGNNLHKGVWIAIGFGLAMLAFVLVIVVLKARNE